MLMVQNVEKKFKDFQALEAVNLEFTNGIYGLLAPNGAGKTTLIKMLTTLIFPTSGEILYGGKNIVEMDADYRELIGYLPQEFGYYKNYSPTTYLMYLAALKGIETSKAKGKIIELLKMVALDDVAHKKMRKFSGGMIQRVGIAQAMLNDPKILILDEPTAGLDPKERVRFRNLLTQLGQDRIIILSTHIVPDVESIAKEIIMIKDKKVQHRDTISNICNLLKDRVFEFHVTYDEIDDFRKEYYSLSEKQEADKTKVRFISDDHHPDWQPVAPSLEDVFLHVFQDEV